NERRKHERREKHHAKGVAIMAKSLNRGCIRSVFISFVLSLSISPAVSWAQSNTFPATGNVGIGTTAPSMPLQITNPNPAGGDTLKLQSGANASSTGVRIAGPSGDTAAIRAKSTNPAEMTATELQFYTNST